MNFPILSFRAAGGRGNGRYKSLRSVAMLIALWLSSAEQALAIEEPEYEVVETAGAYEIRRYAPFLVAETRVQGDFSAVGNEGFRRLAGYIFGGNRRSEKMAMTAPVQQSAAPRGEKIAMTAPVRQQAGEDGWAIGFVMPSQYSLETLPEPDDDRVTLRRVEGRLMAALRYSGFWSQARYAKHEALLFEWLQAQGYRRVGQPEFARYDPPFMPWFLRRNEILVEVATRD